LFRQQWKLFRQRYGQSFNGSLFDDFDLLRQKFLTGLAGRFFSCIFLSSKISHLIHVARSMQHGINIHFTSCFVLSTKTHELQYLKHEAQYLFAWYCASIAILFTTIEDQDFRVPRFSQQFHFKIPKQASFLSSLHFFNTYQIRRNFFLIRIF